MKTKITNLLALIGGAAILIYIFENIRRVVIPAPYESIRMNFAKPEIQDAVALLYSRMRDPKSRSGMTELDVILPPHLRGFRVPKELLPDLIRADWGRKGEGRFPMNNDVLIIADSTSSLVAIEFFGMRSSFFVTHLPMTCPPSFSTLELRLVNKLYFMSVEKEPTEK